jgi:protein-tyrosine phosphatase
MGRRAQKIAAALGADGSAHRASELTDKRILSADLILTATHGQRDSILQRVPSALRRTFALREAGRIAENLVPAVPETVEELRAIVAQLADNRSPILDVSDDDVVDPQGRGDTVHFEMVQQLVPPLAQLAAVMFGMPQPDLLAYRDAVHDPTVLVGRPSTQGDA